MKKNLENVYKHVYNETANSQTMICPFSFDFDATGGIIIAGDNDLNDDDYNFISFSPY